MRSLWKFELVYKMAFLGNHKKRRKFVALRKPLRECLRKHMRKLVDPGPAPQTFIVPVVILDGYRNVASVPMCRGKWGMERKARLYERYKRLKAYLKAFESLIGGV